MVHDLRFAVRQLFKAPGFALAVILTLTLSIGVNTAVFSILNGFLLRALPYPQPERIAALVVHQEGVQSGSNQPTSEDDDSFTGDSWQLLKSNIKGAIFASWGGSNGVNLQAGPTAGGTVKYVQESRVSARYFEVLGIPLYRGRSFTENEDRPQGPPVAVLSYRLWASTFGSDPQIIGRTVRLKGEPHTVVGILPPNAQTPQKVDLFTPLRPAPTGECGGNNCGIVVRLQSGWTWPQINAQLSRTRLPYFSEFETQTHGRAWVYARPLQLELAGDMREKVIVLMLAVSFILLIACANLAGLSLVRLSRRRQEIVTRLALGGSGFAIQRQLWVETLVLALLGATGGLGLAMLVLHALQSFLPVRMIPLGGFALDARMLAFTLSASLLTSFLFGALPAWQTRRLDLRSSLSAGSRSVLGGSNGIRQWLIGAEVALTVVLLASAGLLVRTLIHLEARPPGFDSHNVLTAQASLDDARYHEKGAFHSLLAKSVEAMQEIPGVQGAAVGLSVPYERGLNYGLTISDGIQAGKGFGSSLAYVTPDYFSVLRIPLLAGRVFTVRDSPNSQPVAIVNTDFGKRFYNDPSPIGRHFETAKTTFTIVGIVADVAKKPGMEQTAPISTEPVFYLPVTQTPQEIVNIAHIWNQPSWIVRTNGFIGGLTIAMQRALAKADPNLPLSGFRSMDQILAEQLQQQRVELLLLATLACLALLLSAVGIYALVSNLVVQRTREIGIRMALGSTIQQAMLHVGSSGIVAALAGLVSGLVLSFFALRVLSSEIYGIQVYDPVTLTAVPLLLILVAGSASFLPTLRISRIQPADTLRSE